MSDEETSDAETASLEDSFDEESQDTLEPIELEDTEDVAIHTDMMVEDEDSEEDEPSFQKLDKTMKMDYLSNYHPEETNISDKEIYALSQVMRDEHQNIIDPLHRTVPFMTKYEFTRILGVRSKQLNEGAKPYIDVPNEIIDGYLIAQLELQQKKVPFIIRRPIPGGGNEFWKVSDLEILM
jgi:DNA-directed RNA polymerase I, II, and III subunit RPABC2